MTFALSLLPFHAGFEADGTPTSRFTESARSGSLTWASPTAMGIGRDQPLARPAHDLPDADRGVGRFLGTRSRTASAGTTSCSCSRWSRGCSARSWRRISFLFYVFWEAMLIPMYFLIGIWGGKDRIYAAMKFFLYTMVGSLLMLVAIFFLAWAATRSSSATYSTAHYVDLYKVQLSRAARWPGAAVVACSWPSRWLSRSRSRFFRSIPGCRTPTSKRRPRAA